MTEPQGGQDDSWATQSIFFLFFFVDFLMVFCFVLFVWGFLVFNACYSVFYYGGLFVAVLAICGEKVSQICGFFFSSITSGVQKQLPLYRSTTAVL